MNDFKLPKMSWDYPIEERILKYVQDMARNMEDVSRRHHSKSIREGAENYAKAYRTVERKVLNEMELQERLNKLNE